MLDGMLNVYAKPPESPDECIFAQTTECFSSDLERRITPCQFGGNPDCQNCGCIASAGLEAIGRHRLRGGIPVGQIFYASLAVGHTMMRPASRGARRQARAACGRILVRCDGTRVDVRGATVLPSTFGPRYLDSRTPYLAPSNRTLAFSSPLSSDTFNTETGFLCKFCPFSPHRFSPSIEVVQREYFPASSSRTDAKDCGHARCTNQDWEVIADESKCPSCEPLVCAAAMGRGVRASPATPARLRHHHSHSSKAVRRRRAVRRLWSDSAPGTIPAGQEVDVRLRTTLSSETATVEQRFETTTVADLLQSGRVLVPAGSVIRGVVMMWTRPAGSTVTAR